MGREGSNGSADRVRRCRSDGVDDPGMVAKDGPVTWGVPAQTGKEQWMKEPYEERLRRPKVCRLALIRCTCKSNRIPEVRSSLAVGPSVVAAKTAKSMPLSTDTLHLQKLTEYPKYDLPWLSGRQSWRVSSSNMPSS